MTARRILLFLLMFALPMQGSMAAARLCTGSMHPPAADTAGPTSQADQGSTVASAGHVATDGHSAHHGSGSADKSAPADQPPATDHEAAACKLCAACCLTIAIASPIPTLVPIAAGFAGYRSIVVPVPHNVADGLERPPRTI